MHVLGLFVLAGLIVRCQPQVLSPISLCSTTIYINSEPFRFHADSLQDLDKVADAFCVEHIVNTVDCNVIKSNHIDHCFTSSSGVDSDKDQIDQIEKTDSLYSRQHSEVDYSIKVGPILQIFDSRNGQDGKIFNCQAYQGEGIARAVKRCCVTLQLDISHCEQVRTEFDRLQKAHDSRLQNLQNTPELVDGFDPREQPNTSEDVSESGLNELFQYIYDIINSYYCSVVFYCSIRRFRSSTSVIIVIRNEKYF